MQILQVIEVSEKIMVAFSLDAYENMGRESKRVRAKERLIFTKEKEMKELRE